jgi:hypothetical protein
MSTRWQNMNKTQRVKARARQKRYWAKNRERLAAKKNRHYHKFRDKYLQIERARSYGKLYGITVADYEAMLRSQGGGCAICGALKAGPKTVYFAVDHCHDTGVVRGLLCISCNTRLGVLPWYEQYKNRIAEYLAAREAKAS